MTAIKLVLFPLLFAGSFFSHAAPLRLNAGGPTIPSLGWLQDGKFASKGSVGTITAKKVSVTGSWEQIYRSHRYSTSGDLVYKIPVNPGSYPIFLLWSETWSGSGVGKRVFTVKVNGQNVNKNGIQNGVLDVYKVTGGTYKPLFINLGEITAVNGFITIELGRIPGKNNPFISGIVLNKKGSDALVWSVAGPSAPAIDKTPSKNHVDDVPPSSIEKSCGEAKKTTGRLGKNIFAMNVGGKAIPSIGFGADNTNYVVSKKGWKGTTKTKIAIPGGGSWTPAYQTFRAVSGKLIYKIPFPAGKFKVATMHGENWFKSPNSRLFDIIINGVTKKVNVDIVKQVGVGKSLYLSFPGIPSVNGFITIELVGKKSNPILNGLHIAGPNAAQFAIGGAEDGSCKPATETPVVPKEPEVPNEQPETIIEPQKKPGETLKIIGTPETNFKGEHFAHAVSGGPYVNTDFDKDGKGQVTLDGTNSHSHKQEGTETGKVVTYKWAWKDPSNPKAAKDGYVTVTAKKTTQTFPLGVTDVSLLVIDQFGYSAIETTTVTINSATVPGAYCYYYNLGQSNPSSVFLPVDVKKPPKPLKGVTVGDINFGNTASFNVPFAKNTFSVRCVFYVDVKEVGTFQYKIVHSGPMKAYHNDKILAKSDSKQANKATMTPPQKYTKGLQSWQVHYLKPKGMNGKLSFQFGSGNVVPASYVRHDAGTTLPVITGLGKTSTSPSGGELIGIFGSAFVNGVTVKFGEVEAETVETTAGTIQARAPPGSGTVKITVATKAGVSNGVSFTYNSKDIPVKFNTQFVKNAGGGKFFIPQIAALTYGPDQRLYLGAVNSMIHALTLNKGLQVTKHCKKNVNQKYPRTVLGVAFNPKSNALKLYMTTSTIFWKDRKQFTNFGQGWTNGKVQSITMAGKNGCFNDDLTDVVTGLPVSNHDHAVNAITFLPNGKMLIAVGGFTNGGVSVPFDNLGGVPSNPLSGALVVCPGGGGNIKYSNINNPLKAKVIGGGCSVWASGLRNTFSLQLHTNGHVYATDNGPNKNFGMFSTNCNGGQKASKNIPDKLFKAQFGKWHGHPNINRKQCVFGGSQVQPLKANLESSTNGILEYRSNTFGGKIKGDLFIVKFAVNGNGKMSRAQLDEAGDIKPNGFTNIFLGKSGLAIVEGPRGEMLMPRVYQSSILVATPVYPTPSVTTLISVLPNRGSAGGGTTIQISGHHFGNAPKVKIGGKPCLNVKSLDKDTLTCVTPNGTPNSKVPVSVTGTKGTSSSKGSDYWYF